MIIEGGDDPWTKGGGMKGSTRRWRLSRNSAGGSSGLERNCPGRVDGVPKINSAEETADCSNGTLLSPRSTKKARKAMMKKSGVPPKPP